MWNVLLLIVGFLCLIKGADWFVDGASKLAARFGIPQLVIGLTIVAMGTSLPEAAVSIRGAMKGTAGIAVGNALGSNIFNVLVILGVTALLAVLPLQRSTLFIEIPYMLFVTVVILLLGMGGVVAQSLLYRKIRTAEDVEKELGLPVLGMVPDADNMRYEHQSESFWRKWRDKLWRK